MVAGKQRGTPLGAIAYHLSAGDVSIMSSKTNSRIFQAASLFVVLALTAGCSIAVDKSKDGEDKNVKIDTPLGGVHVNSDGTTAADVGLPVYPGAQIASKKDGDKAADIRFGFGDWQFRLKVVKYFSSDSPDQVIAFYRKALGRYGDVIQCSGSVAVGTPTITSEGLTCSDSENNHNVKIDSGQSLKAGSKRHQHIVGIEKNDTSGTTFSLVELDLPAGTDEHKGETN
jgi:hypothetical protein